MLGHQLPAKLRPLGKIEVLACAMPVRAELLQVNPVRRMSFPLTRHAEHKEVSGLGNSGASLVYRDGWHVRFLSAN